MTLKQKILSGVFWQGLTNVGSYGLNFIISVILARLLSPEDFGVIAIIGVFVGLLGVFVNAGFSSALIQKKILETEDCSSVFFLNLVTAPILYALLFFAAPWIAQFYNRADLTLYIRVLSFNLIISSWSLVQAALITKRMLFHLNFRISLIGICVSGTLGIIMAYMGFGPWALIAQQLLNALLVCIFQWIWGGWRPHLILEFSRLYSLFKFGWKLFCSNFLDNLYGSLYPLLIGKLFNLSTLSYFNRGQHIPSIGMNVINSTIGTVLFPAFSQVQNDREKMHRIMREALLSIMFLLIPNLTVLFVCAHPLILFLYGTKWLPSVPFLQIFCAVFFFWPLHTMNLQLLTACGRSDVFLILEIIKKIQAVLVILLTFRYGPLVMAGGMAGTGILGFIENSWMSGKLAGYSTWRQTLDILPILAVSVLSGLCAWLVSCAFENPFLSLLLGGSVFAAVYLSTTILLRMIPDEIMRQIRERSPWK